MKKISYSYAYLWLKTDRFIDIVILQFITHNFKAIDK